MKDLKNHLAAIINTYGKGQHPFADVNNLDYFEKDYIKECLQIAWDKNDDEHRRQIITNIKDSL